MNCNRETGISLSEGPFLLSPKGKSFLWGGTKLKDEYFKDINLTPLSETWECSTHPDGQSTIDSGEYKGWLLSDVIKNHPEYLGICSNGDLPILIKLIDAKQDLSIQVHPDDSFAREHDGVIGGKREFWYILDAEKNSTITYGFLHELSKNDVRECIYNGTIEDHLQKISVKRGEVYFIPAGCVHAIGSGVLIAEVQDNSSLTYRLYDYNRKDKNGQLRELQVEKAIEVACLKKALIPKQPITTMRSFRGYQTEKLHDSEYFYIERIRLNTEQCQKSALFNNCSKTFQVLLCIDGYGSLFWRGEWMFNFKKGDCFFIPSNSAQIKLQGVANFLRVKPGYRFYSARHTF